MFLELNPDIMINVSAIQVIQIEDDKRIIFHLLEGSGRSKYRIDTKDRNEVDKILKSIMSHYRDGKPMWVNTS